MHKGARTDPCGGRGVTRVPTATNSAKKVSNINAGIVKVSTTRRWLPRNIPCTLQTA
jgi:hypothetical protein